MPRPSPLTLLAALSALITFALVGSLIFVLIHTMPQKSAPDTRPAGGAYITTAQTTSGVDKNGSPIDSTTSFGAGQTVYIAYTVTDAGPGTVTIKLYNNGAFVDSTTQQFPQRSSYTAYFHFTAASAGNWEADLYWQNRGAAGDGSLEQRITFLVGNTSSLAVSRWRVRV
jgi:hypothetical protein